MTAQAMLPGLLLETTLDGPRIVQRLYREGLPEHAQRQVLDTSEDGVRAMLIALGWTPPKTKVVRAYVHPAPVRIPPADLEPGAMCDTLRRVEIAADRCEDLLLAGDLHRLLASRERERQTADRLAGAHDRAYAAGRQDERRSNGALALRAWRADYLAALGEAGVLRPPGNAPGEGERAIPEAQGQGAEMWAGGAVQDSMRRATDWIARTSPWADAPYEGGFEQLRQDVRGLLLQAGRA